MSWKSGSLSACTGNQPPFDLGGSSEPCNAAPRSNSGNSPMELAVAFSAEGATYRFRLKAKFHASDLSSPCPCSVLSLARLLPRMILPCRQRTGYWDKGLMHETERRTVDRDKLHAPCHVSGRTPDSPTAIPGTRVLSITATILVASRSGCTKIAGSG